MILKIDEEDFGGHSVLLQEGLFASITLFLVVWLLPFLFQFFLSQKLGCLQAQKVNKRKPWLVSILTHPASSFFSILQLSWILAYSLAHF
jgi:hypothetical protein